LLGDGISSVRVVSRQLTFRYHSPEHMLDVFRVSYGPTKSRLRRSTKPAATRSSLICSPSNTACIEQKIAARPCEDYSPAPK